MKPYIAAPIAALVLIRSYRRRSLTLPASFAAAATAIAHALHPSALPFTLLLVFFVLGTTATKVKHEVKSTLTLSSGGGSGGEGPRTAKQVLANSGFASLLCLLHVFKYGIGSALPCFPSKSQNDVLSTLYFVGIIANYTAVTADTLSSELGILAKQQPVLVTNPFKKVPKGTNGGVTLGGLLYGILGSVLISATSLLLLPICSTSTTQGSLLDRTKALFTFADTPSSSTPSKLNIFLLFTLCGTIGTLLDSVLGALLQASVIDQRSGKVVEGSGGTKVLTHRHVSSPSPSSPQRRKTAAPGLLGVNTDKLSSQRPDQESRYIGTGRDWLDNNQINFLMAATISIGAMGVTALL